MSHCSYKFRLYPTKCQEETLRKTIGSARFIYNWGLRLRKDAWDKEGRTVGYFESCKELSNLKKNEETKWLNDVSSVALQQSLKYLDKSFKSFFKKQNRYPKFKSKKNGGNIKILKNGMSLKDGVFKIYKIKGPIEVVWSRGLPINPLFCTINVNPSNQWFVSFVCETAFEKLPTLNKKIGIDLGIESFASFSDGSKIKQPDSIKMSRKKLARARKAHSRKKLGSKNREKARLKVARAYQKVTNIRQDFLHKLSSQLIRENQVIVVEDLRVSSMIKKGNHNLSRLIGEQGWRDFRTMLEYKAGWYGREIIVVDKYLPSSQMCNACGKTNKVPLGKRTVKCECGVAYDRDINAAKNILAAGMAVSACGVDVRPVLNGRLTAKQEDSF